MKKTFKLIGIIAAVAVIGFSMAACNQANDPAPPPPPPPGPGQNQPPPPVAHPLVGTWSAVGGVSFRVLDGEHWEWWEAGEPFDRGTYEILAGGNSLAMTVTQEHDGWQWVALPTPHRTRLTPFSISGNTLTLYDFDGRQVLTR